MWKSKFQSAKSKKEIFHISSTEKNLVTMMRQKGTFNHCRLTLLVIINILKIIVKHYLSFNLNSFSNNIV